MKQLRIYFKNKALDEISWCFMDGNSVLQHGETHEPTLKKIALSAHEVIFIVAQHWVYETRIDIQDKSARQLLSAAAYQLEDQFAEDVDTLHFAQGPEHNNTVPFIVIKHELMQAMLAFEKQHHIVATHIINEIALCPPAEKDQVNVFYHQQHALFKGHDEHLNSVCPVSQIEFFTEYLKRQNPNLDIKHIDPEQEHVLCHPIELAKQINLKQKDYSTSHIWQSVAKTWAFPIMLCLLSGVAYLVNIGQSNAQLADKIQQLQEQQATLVKHSLADYSPAQHAKTALIKALQKQQGAQQQSGFIRFFHQFLQAKKNVKGITLEKADYKNKKLIVDVSADNLQQLDQLIIALKNYFKVTVAQMDSSNNTSQGRFILEQS